MVMGEEDCEVGRWRVMERADCGGRREVDMASGVTDEQMDDSMRGWLADWILGFTGGGFMGQDLYSIERRVAYWMG